MKCVWITGAAGFLGRWSARLFLAEGWRVVGLGHVPRPPDGLPPVSVIDGASAFVPGALSAATLSAALRLFGPPDAVLHAAGSGSVGPSFANPLADFERAVASTALLLDVLRRDAPQARLIMASSAAVYGEQPDRPIPEETLPAPASPYGAHKLAAEILCRQAHLSFGQPVAVLRLFSLYGQGLRKQLLWDLANRLATRPAELAMAGSGGETRDFIHVEDAAALALTAASGEGFTLVNGGTGVRSTVRSVAEGLARRLSPGTRLAFSAQARPGDPQHFLADPARGAALGFVPRVGIEAGLDAYVDWLREEGIA